MIRIKGGNAVGRGGGRKSTEATVDLGREEICSTWGVRKSIITGRQKGKKR